MNLFIPKKYGIEFTLKIVNKLVKDIKLLLLFTDLRLIDLWLIAEFGIDNSIKSKDIILYALDNIEIVQMSYYFKVEFNQIKYFPGTSIRMITLLKAICYGNRYFRGNPFMLNEFKKVNNNIEQLYEFYDRIGVVI